MKVTSMVTRYSTILLFSTFPFREITLKPVMPRKVLAARFTPSSTASLKPLEDAAVILVTRATAIRILPYFASSTLSTGALRESNEPFSNRGIAHLKWDFLFHNTPDPQPTPRPL